MLQNGLGALFLSGALNFPMSEATQILDLQQAKATTVAFEFEPAPENSASDSFLTVSPDSNNLKSEFLFPSWACPALSIFSLAGLYKLRRSAQDRRLRHDLVKLEVAERFANLGGIPEALVHDESVKCGTLGWSRGHSIQTLGQAKQALSSYMEFEKIQFYLENIPQSVESKQWAREALKIRVNLFEKISTYLDHCRADLLDCMAFNRRSVRRFLLCYSAYERFLKMLLTTKSPLTGDYIGLAQKAQDILMVSHKHYGRLVSAKLV